MSEVADSIAWMRRLVGVSLLALVGVSWRLWLPPGEFPQIPWWGFLCRAPGFADYGLLALLLPAAAFAAVGPAGLRSTGWSLGWTSLALVGLVQFDQHRLQPWAYHLALVSSLLALAPNETGLRCCRALIISVYAWSGWSKVDLAFLEAHGQMLLDGVLQALGLSGQFWTLSQRQFAAGVMPASELLIALSLVGPWSRRWGCYGSILMHLTLLAALGPWGLNHEPAVLLWNMTFIVQNLLLFRGRAAAVPAVPILVAAPSAPARAAVAASSTGRFVAGVVTAAAAGLPALNPWGGWDHWPSWSVYSSRPARVQLLVREAAVARLPASLQPLVDPPLPLSDWRPVRLDSWSFESLAVPPYPQGRWRLAIAAAVARRAALGEDEVRVILERRRDWWSSVWMQTELDGMIALDRELRRYRLNVEPRR